MKKNLFYIIISALLFAAGGFYGCNEKIDAEAGNEMKGMSIVPNPMTVGQSVSISGPGFSDASAIVFPGGVSVTNFTKVGHFQLNVIVPSGTASEGNISVTLPDGNVTIPMNVTIFTTGNIRASAMEVNSDGNTLVGPNDKITIRGEGLGSIAEVIFPGDLSIKAMNFASKTNSSIEIVLPMSGFDRTAVEPIKMISETGQTFFTSNRVDFGGKGYVPEGLLLLCGRSYKIWTWYQGVSTTPEGNPWGNNSYATGVWPAWWTLSVDDISGQVGANDAKGATMKFELPNKYTKTLANGTVIEGYFAIAMGPVAGTRGIAELIITGGPDNLTLLGGTYGGGGNRKNYSLTVLDVTTMTYVIRHTNGDGYFSVFQAIDGDLSGE